MNNVIRHLIEQLQDIQHGKNWIGSSFDSKLIDVPEAQVFVRPLPQLHSIAETISHLTMWRQEAALKIRTGAGSKTDQDPENWLTNDDLTPKGWNSIKTAYDQSLADLISLIQDKDDSFLEQEYYDPDFKGNYSYRFLLEGMLHHDIYHLGQLGITIKYLKLSYRD